MSEHTTSLEGKRGRSRGLSVLTTGAVGALAIGLVVGGALVLQGRAAAVQIDAVAPPVTVQVRAIVFEDGYTVSRSFVGQVEAQQSTDASFELAGRVASVIVGEGDSVAKGEVIARLDTRTLENQRATRLASRQALEAQAELAELATERRGDLVSKGFSTQAGLDQARLGLAELRARIAEVDSLIAGIDIELDKSALRAPFDGRVGRRFVDDGATVGSGQPIVTLLQVAAPQIRVGLAKDVASGLTPGERAMFELSGESLTARFVKIRPDLDPVTRTRVALFSLEISTAEAAPPYGQTGTVTLAQRIGQSGVWVPSLHFVKVCAACGRF